MSKHILLILILAAISSTACNKLDIENGTPTCIEDLIHDFDKEQPCDNGTNVKEYTFQGETVYAFNPGNCGADMATEVLTADCNSLGLLGGIIGNNHLNGDDFSEATFVSLTWEK